jgi:hypothetical protein
MKKLVLTLVAGAFGSLLVLPIAHAQDYQDMSNDANAIHQDQRNINHDKREMREDLENGNFGAAARESQEMQERRAQQQDTERDLNRDLSHSYDRDGDAYRHHHDRDEDTND